MDRLFPCFLNYLSRYFGMLRIVIGCVEKLGTETAIYLVIRKQKSNQT